MNRSTQQKLNLTNKQQSVKSVRMCVHCTGHIIVAHNTAQNRNL